MRSVVPSEEGPTQRRVGEAVAGAADHASALKARSRAKDPDEEDRGPAARVVGADRAAWSGVRRPLWDNEPGIGCGKHHADGVDAFMGTLATQLVLLPPRGPEFKGVVERRNAWLETSFMPGRSFASPADFNDQFTEWLALAIGGSWATCTRGRYL